MCHAGRYTPEEIATQLRGSNARVVFTHADTLAKVEQAVKDAPNVREIVLLGDQGTGGRTSLRALVEGAGEARPSPLSIANDFTAVLPYSSGTTGNREKQSSCSGRAGE